MKTLEKLLSKWEKEYRAEKVKEVNTLFNRFLEVIKELKPETTTILMAIKMLEHATVEEKLNEYEKTYATQASEQ